MEVAVVADLRRIDALRQAGADLRECLIPQIEQGLDAGTDGAAPMVRSCRKVVERPSGPEHQCAGPG